MLSCYTNSLSNIDPSIKLLIILFMCQVVLMEAIQLILLVVHCCIEILVFGMSQYFYLN